MKPKVKIKNDSIECFDYMKTNKDNLKNIIKDTSILPIIEELVIRTNKIVIHAYQFLKLYLLHLYENNIPFPELTKDYISDIFKVITKRKCGSGGYTEKNMPLQLQILTNFYKSHYSQTISESNDDILYYDKLSYILPYESIDMITNINNNIQEHFISHLNRYVNVVFNLKSKKESITKNTKDKLLRKELHKNLYQEFNKIKKDLTTFNEELISDHQYHEWINLQKQKLFPNKTSFDSKSNNIHYELKSNTQYFLTGMFHMCNELEKINNERIINSQDQIKLFNVLPLRTNIIAKNICIDTCGLISNLLGNESTSEHLKNYKKDDNQFELWNRFFRLNKQVFKKNNYMFNYMIRTDGISCCILFIRVDKNGKLLSKTYQNKKCCQTDNMKYIEDIEITSELKKKRIVCIDPNVSSDLIYCGSRNENNELITFRYTQNQRRLETRKKKYSKIIDNVNKETIVNNKSVKEIETLLSESKLNSKTCNYDKFKEYCIEKNKINKLLFKHYEQTFFRKFKLNAFINTQKSESKMIQNFKNKFGDPQITAIVVGDFSKDHNMKGLEPAVNKRFRRLFKNTGYETYLINEFRTSKLCNCCNNELETFIMKPSKKPKTKGQLCQCFGLLRCKSVMPQCKVIHNRDKNAVQNMLNIVESIFNTGKRPIKFTRETSFPLHDGI